MLKVQILDYYRCLDPSDYIEETHENVTNELFSSDESTDTPDIYSENYQKKLVKTQKMLIKIFGITQDGKSITINAKDFQPYFYINIPENWDVKDVSFFTSKIKSMVYKKFSDNLLKVKMIKRKPFTEFTGEDLFKFLKLSFKNKESFDAYARLLQKPIVIKGQNIITRIFESNIDPIIKFIHEMELNSTGWIIISGYKSLTYEKTSSTFYEVDIQYDKIQPIESFELAPIKLVSFDIEADSSHGDFPVAKKNYQKLAQELITIYNKYGVSSTNGKMHDLFKNSAKETLEYLISLAFNEHYIGNNVIKLKGKELEELSSEIHLFPKYVDEIINGTDDVFMKKYGELYNIIKKEIERLIKIKNKRYLKNPKEVIKLMLNLSIDKYYEAFNISNIHTKYGIKPNKQTVAESIDVILLILKNCGQFIREKRLPDSAVFSMIEDYKIKVSKNLRGKAKALKEKINIEEVKQDEFVEILTDYFDENFPPVEGDQVIQIGSTFQSINEKDCYLKHIICLDTCQPITNDELIEAENGNVYLPAEDLAKDLVRAGYSESEDTYWKDTKLLADIIKTFSREKRQELSRVTADYRKKQQLLTDKAKVIVEYYKTEEEVLLAWQRLIKKEDPDIITGYNIFGFDFRFLYGRASELEIISDFCQLSRLDNHVSSLVEMTVASAALGDNKLEYIEMKGRILIDLYKVIQTSQSLDNYKLDSVCNKFLYKEKVDLSPQDIFIKQRGSAEDRKEIAKYCIIDCILCNRLLFKLEILGNSIAMGSVCKVPLSYIFIRGQGVKIASLATYECNKNGYLVPVLEKADGDNQGYEGAIVLHPQIGIHFEPTVTLDFNSLYPSSMISENLSTDTFVEIGGKYDNLENYEYSNVEYDIFEWRQMAGRKKMEKIKTGVKTCRYVQFKDGKKGIIPMILQNLLSARKSAKKQMEAETDPFKAKIWNGRQLAYKTVSNSVYGQLGAPTGLLYKPEIAASTTAVGRRMITFSRDYVMKEYKEKIVCLTEKDTLSYDDKKTKYEGLNVLVKNSYCVYGDTDSVFIRFNMYNFTMKDGKIIQGEKILDRDAIFISMALGKQVAREISAQLKRPQNLDFEKVISPFILFSKKRYCGHYYTKMDKDSFYLNSMGIVLKRRDNAPIVKHIYGGVIKIIMNEHDVGKAYQFLQDECKKLLKGEFPMDQFTVSKTLKSYYKFPNRIAHNVLAMRQAQRDPGNKFSSNDRVPYIYIVPPKSEKSKLQGDLIETPDFIIKNKLKINYELYLTNQIQVPVSQIFKLEKGYENIDMMFAKMIDTAKNEAMGMKSLENYFIKREKTFTSLSSMNKKLLNDREAEPDIEADVEEDTLDIDYCSDDDEIGESILNNADNPNF